MAARGTSNRVKGPADWPEHIRARYGLRQRPRWVAPALAALLTLGIVATTVVGWRLSRPEISAGVLTYQTLSDEAIRVTYEVQRRDAVPATCLLRARAPDGFDVAYATVQLPAASGRTTHEYVLRTAYRALLAELLGCGVGGPPAGVQGAQFRPGVVPPEQPWSP